MDRDLSIVKGNTLNFFVNFTLTDDEDIEDITEIYFSGKDKLTDSEYAFQLTLDNGITLQEGTTKFLVSLSHEITSTLEVENYYYDLTFVMNGNVFTIMKGILKVEPNVTDVPVS